MEKKNNNNSNKSKNINSPIFNYYSHIINSQSPQYNSEIIQTNQMNFSSSESSISLKNHEDNQTNKLREFIIDEIHDDDPKDISFIPKNNTKTDPNIDGIKNNKSIKSIKVDDLIPTTINGRSILRINPLIYKGESYQFLSNNIYILLKDQLGSKYLQEKLETDTIQAVCYFYPAILPHLLVLIKDLFANYFIQKICYYLNEDQIENILKIISPEFFEICCDSHGTRVIQGIMDYLQTEKLRILFYEMIKPLFISLINELNGIHIIYKFINGFPEFNNEINNIIVDNCLSLSTRQRGCFFIQNYLMMLNIRIEHKQKILDIIFNNCSILIIDKIGNYLIQYLLSLIDDKIILTIINKTINNISFYSKHKYANFVIEKLFFYANPKDKNLIIDKLSSPDIMTDLIFDQKGNFIILKVLSYLGNEKRNIMLNTINNLKPKIEKIPHGKYFLNKLNNINLYLKSNKY